MVDTFRNPDMVPFGFHFRKFLLLIDIHIEPVNARQVILGQPSSCLLLLPCVSLLCVLLDSACLDNPTECLISYFVCLKLFVIHIFISQIMTTDNHDLDIENMIMIIEVGSFWSIFVLFMLFIFHNFHLIILQVYYFSFSFSSTVCKEKVQL